MTLRERLEQLVRTAPRGTLIPVEGLAELIQAAADEETDLDVEDVGRLAATSFGRPTTYSAGAVRKWIRSGLKGVRLPAYPAGKEYRVRRRDFDRFVADVRGQNAIQPPRAEHMVAGTLPADDDFESEIRDGQVAYAARGRR